VSHQSTKQGGLIDKRIEKLLPQLANWEAELKNLAAEFDKLEQNRVAAVQKVALTDPGCCRQENCHRSRPKEYPGFDGYKL
jgi:hypothetical protein